MEEPTLEATEPLVSLSRCDRFVELYQTHDVFAGADLKAKVPLEGAASVKAPRAAGEWCNTRSESAK